MGLRNGQFGQNLGWLRAFCWPPSIFKLISMANLEHQIWHTLEIALAHYIQDNVGCDELVTISKKPNHNSKFETSGVYLKRHLYICVAFSIMKTRSKPGQLNRLGVPRRYPRWMALSRDRVRVGNEGDRRIFLFSTGGEYMQVSMNFLQSCQNRERFFWENLIQHILRNSTAEPWCEQWQGENIKRDEKG